MSSIVIPKAPNTANLEEITSVFNAQRENAMAISQSSARERKRKIKKIQEYTLDHANQLTEALYKDFRKTEAETILSETMIVDQEAQLALKHLEKWMKPEKVPTPITHVGTSSYIHRVAKGNMLIMAPWNYPFQLAIRPLVMSVAAGNVNILKPSEMTPHTSAFIKTMIGDIFAENECAVFEGDATIGQHLLSLPFNHIHFTGSPQVGKIVMRAAAEHLTSVTLELGGKSPAIVDESANIKDIAEKFAWGKTFNNGQTCIAPDYAIVHHSVKEKFINYFKNALDKMYDEGSGIENSTSYCRIINANHFHRITQLIDDAVQKGANIEAGGHTNPEDNYIAPTLLTDVNDDMDIMHEEIFGPVLPVIEYEKKSDVLEIINARPRPLAMYIGSRNKKNVDYFLNGTISGDVLINDSLIHFAHNGIPVGGVNNSGIGKSGGHASFKEMTHERSVVQQVYGTFKPLYPPYTDSVMKIIRTMLKWL